MSSDAPSERPRSGKPGTGPPDRSLSGKEPGKTSRWANKIGGKSWAAARSDLGQLRNAFRPPEPDSLKKRLRKLLRPFYNPFNVVLLAALGFSLV